MVPNHFRNWRQAARESGTHHHQDYDHQIQGGKTEDQFFQVDPEYTIELNIYWVYLEELNIYLLNIYIYIYILNLEYRKSR